nr:MAG TPA: hypothetical protein [Caudoviricetes sp.]
MQSTTQLSEVRNHRKMKDIVYIRSLGDSSSIAS